MSSIHCLLMMLSMKKYLFRGILMSDNKYRKENIVWTVSGDYSDLPAINFFDLEDEKYVLYKMSLLGSAYKYFDMDKVFDFLYKHLNKTELKNEFLKLFEIYLDDCLHNRMLDDRPGVKKNRQDFFEKKIEKYDKYGTIEVEEEIEYLYYSILLGRFALVRDVVEKVVNNLHQYNKPQNTEDLINNINAVFLKYFYVNLDEYSEKDDKNLDNKNSNIQNDKKNDSKKDRPRIDFRMNESKDYKKKINENSFSINIESAEFTNQLSESGILFEENDNSNKKISRASNDEKIEKMVIDRFGLPIINQYTSKTVEKNSCIGIHKGIKFLYTDGEFGDQANSRFFKSEINKQKNKNIDYFNENELLFKRTIRELVDFLRKRVENDELDKILKIKQGKLMSSQVWRSGYLNDSNIFYNERLDNRTSMSVDILLDSSASQLGREENISSQVYIISQALSELKIPCRVIGFSNFFNYLIFKKFRDYENPKNLNENIFTFKGAGSNRDGLAIKILAKDILANKYEKKILIILSDGKPNNIVDLKSKSFIKLDAIDYEGELAIRNTQEEVFNGKLNDIHILGIYTGEEEDLETEKSIYGRDFAYIKNIKRFSKIIGFYLSQVINFDI